jgi:tellurite methyltransferase
MDSIPDTKPDVVAYPTHMPFRDRSFDAVLLTHILMFLEDKSHWPAALEEATRIARGYVVVETYRVKHKQSLTYTDSELIKLVSRWRIIRRNVRQDMQNFVLGVS